MKKNVVSLMCFVIMSILSVLIEKIGIMERGLAFFIISSGTVVVGIMLLLLTGIFFDRKGLKKAIKMSSLCIAIQLVRIVIPYIIKKENFFVIYQMEFIVFIVINSINSTIIPKKEQKPHP